MIFLNEKMLRLDFEVYIPSFGLEACFVLHQPRDAVGDRGGGSCLLLDRREGEGGLKMA